MVVVIDQSSQRFPLAWPAGWKRTVPRQRRRAAFSKGTAIRQEAIGTDVPRTIRKTRPLTVWDAIQRLSGELDRLRATQELVSSNVALRLDGLPRSGQSEPDDPGAAVYFQLNSKPRCLACDRWDRVADNIAAIAQHIDALRRIDRYGVGTMEQAFAGYAALPPGAEDWWLVLGIKPDATLQEVEQAFRRLAKDAHPDVGGSHDQMAKLTEARAIAKEGRT